MKEKKRKKLKKLWDKSAVNNKDYSELRLIVRLEHDVDAGTKLWNNKGGTVLGNVERFVEIRSGKNVDKMSVAIHKKLSQILKEDIEIFMASVLRETSGDETEWYESSDLSKV
jgi:hypothetical protein